MVISLKNNMDQETLYQSAIEQLHLGGYPAESVKQFVELVHAVGPETKEILLTFVLAEEPEVVHAIIDRYDEIKEALTHPEKTSVADIIESATESLSKE